MGYTHYWRQKRSFTTDEWTRILAEAKRICAKATRAYYNGPETFKTAQEAGQDSMGFRTGFGESGAWRTFPHEERQPAMQGAAIKLAGSSGEAGTQPEFTDKLIALNGEAPDDYESFVLERAPVAKGWQLKDADTKKNGIFNFCKTEYRAYDPVVVSILDAARTVAPDAITLSSDGGEEVFRQMF